MLARTSVCAGVKTTICLGLLAGLLLSHRLWAGARFYPLTPAFPFLQPPPFPVDSVALSAFIILLGLIILISQPARLIYAFVALALIDALFDQSRWQPWFYQYLFMLLAVALRRKDACRLIIVCIYFWSGMQKLNPGFVHETFPWMFGPVAHFVPAFAAPDRIGDRHRPCDPPVSQSRRDPGRLDAHLDSGQHRTVRTRFE